MQTEFFGIESAIQNVAPNDEADAAHENKSHYRETHNPIARKRSQRAEGAVASHKVEARVAESRNGVENGGMQCLPKSELGTQPCRQQQSARAFKNGGADCYAADKVDYAAQSHGACGLHEDFALVQTYFPAENHQGGGDDRHETKPAYLNENENHDLPEARPFEKCVNRYQSRDAGRGRCREQCVGVIRPFSVP